ncbi:MAG: tRNA/rRNA methyltransferase [Fibrobacterota bacterium]
METVFILVNPAVPENIGAAARAIKTAGFSRFRIVSGLKEMPEKSYWTAHGSADILDNAVIFTSLSDSLSDIDFSVACTGRKRKTGDIYYSPEEIREILVDKKENIRKAALVFGSEESGLSNADLNMCDLVSSVPMARVYPSLNLAMAVMVYAYVLSRNNKDLFDWSYSEGKEPVNSGSRLYARIKNRLSVFLKYCGIDERNAAYMKILRRFSACNTRDIKLMEKILSSYEKSRNKF